MGRPDWKEDLKLWPLGTCRDGQARLERRPEAMATRYLQRWEGGFFHTAAFALPVNYLIYIYALYEHLVAWIDISNTYSLVIADKHH